MMKSLLFILVLIVSGLGALPSRGGSWQDKVEPRALQAASQGEAEFLVYLDEQADLSPAAALSEKRDKGSFVYKRLTETARRSQAPLVEHLRRQGLEYRPFWVANFIWVRGGLSDLRAIAQRSEVGYIYANPAIQVDLPPSLVSQAPARGAAIEWNVEQIHAPQVWELGFLGQGVVIGGQDTGYQWDHPALINQYRGWDGAKADHNYNWHDAIHTGGSSGCPSDSLAPCDDNNHGTHTMGTMVGDDHYGNRIGVVPGAQWIGCRNMDRGVGTPATYTECFEWFLAPTDLAGQNPNPDLAPDVINNSWSCPPGEGCSTDSLRTVIENIRAAGILVVVSAGNSGQACSTVTDPPAIYEASFSVGATDSGDQIASFSSRGPVTADGSGRRKPNVSAPGVGVRSSIPTNSYASMQGTSMAGPHVAGLAALLISTDPSLRGQIDQLEDLIEQNAVPLTSPQGCGGDTPTQVPNNTYGWGRVDAWSAYQAIHPQQLQRLYLPLVVN